MRDVKHIERAVLAYPRYIKMLFTTVRGRIALTAAIALCAGAVYFVGGFLNSPEHQIHLAARALNARDAEALLSLASPREKRILNLTPQSVQACLRHSYWSADARSPNIDIYGNSTPWADIRTFSLAVRGLRAGAAPYNFSVDVYQYNGGKWYVGVSELMYSLTRAARIQKGSGPDESWDNIAAGAGVVAVVSASHGTRYTTGATSPKISLTHD